MYVGRDTGSDGKCVLFCVCVFLNANKLTLHHCEHLFDGITTAWVPAHEGKWGQLTPPGKMDEKLNNENMQKRAVFNVYGIF